MKQRTMTLTALSLVALALMTTGSSGAMAEMPNATFEQLQHLMNTVGSPAWCLEKFGPLASFKPDLSPLPFDGEDLSSMVGSAVSYWDGWAIIEIPYDYFTLRSCLRTLLNYRDTLGGFNNIMSAVPSFSLCMQVLSRYVSAVANYGMRQVN